MVMFLANFLVQGDAALYLKRCINVREGHSDAFTMVALTLLEGNEVTLAETIESSTGCAATGRIGSS